MSTRKAIGKKTRFEIFKRDSFKCQYCGQSAPDVVLHIDHIEPVSKGGDNSITNLITACDSCNSGKSNRLLSDDSVIKKQKEQLDELNRRREQLQMILQWRKELASVEDQYVKAFAEAYVTHVNGWHLNENGLNVVKKLLRKYSLDYLLNCLATATEKLDSSHVTQDVAAGILTSVSKIAAFKMLPQHEQKLRYIRGIVRNRMHCNEARCMELLREAFADGVELEELTDIAKTARNWTEWCSIIRGMIYG